MDTCVPERDTCKGTGPKKIQLSGRNSPEALTIVKK
jgi:hypothetical protein